jgi:hypothetical protein
MNITSKIDGTSYVRKNVYSVSYDNGIGVQFKTDETFTKCEPLFVYFLGMKGVDIKLKMLKGKYELTKSDILKYAKNSLKTIKKRKNFYRTDEKRNKSANSSEEALTDT